MRPPWRLALFLLRFGVDRLRLYTLRPRSRPGNLPSPTSSVIPIVSGDDKFSGSQLMAQQNTFDVVSKVDMAEVKNAVNQALKEVQQRYDFKGTNSEIALNEKEHTIVLSTASEFTLKSLNDVLQQKLVRRNVSLKALSYGNVEPAAKDSVRQTVTLQQGIPIEKAREIVKFIKDTKLKVQASINGDFVRVAGKDRDSLQEVIARLKAKDFGIDMQYTNYRSQ
jgi:uncharacterized protein YajQ (UPF0234 family)